MAFFEPVGLLVTCCAVGSVLISIRIFRHIHIHICATARVGTAVHRNVPSMTITVARFPDDDTRYELVRLPYKVLFI